MWDWFVKLWWPVTAEAVFQVLENNQDVRPMLTSFLAANPNINALYAGKTFLTAAVDAYLFNNGPLANVDVLLAKGADPNLGQLSHHLLSCIEGAVCYHRLELVQRLYESPLFNMAKYRTDLVLRPTDVQAEQQLVLAYMLRVDVAIFKVQTRGTSFLLNTLNPHPPALAQLLKHLTEPGRRIMEAVCRAPTSYNDIRTVFFHRQSTAFNLLPELAFYTASFIRVYTQRELQTLREYARLLNYKAYHPN
jgi:hypothetical protein